MLFQVLNRPELTGDIFVRDAIDVIKGSKVSSFLLQVTPRQFRAVNGLPDSGFSGRHQARNRLEAILGPDPAGVLQEPAKCHQTAFRQNRICRSGKRLTGIKTGLQYLDGKSEGPTSKDRDLF